jgi:hypothetical protein
MQRTSRNKWSFHLRYSVVGERIAHPCDCVRKRRTSRVVPRELSVGVALVPKQMMEKGRELFVLCNPGGGA